MKCRRPTEPHRPGRAARAATFGAAVTLALAGHALVLRVAARPGRPVTTARPAATAVRLAPGPTVPPPVATTATASRSPGQSAPRPTAPQTRPPIAADPVPDAPPAGTHWPAEQLDRRPVPVSAPPDPGDDPGLATLPFSGQPLRLRLYIDAQGRVEQVEPVDVDPFDADTLLPRLQAMFLRTAYVPGLRDGREVASVSEIEIRFEHLAPGSP